MDAWEQEGQVRVVVGVEGNLHVAVARPTVHLEFNQRVGEPKHGEELEPASPPHGTLGTLHSNFK